MLILYFYKLIHFLLNVTIQLDDFVPDVILTYVSACYFNIQFNFIYFLFKLTNFCASRKNRIKLTNI